MTQRYIDLAFDDTSPRSFGGFNNENEATVIRLKVLDPDAKYYIEIEQACGKHDKYCSDALPVADGYAIFEVSRDFTHETLYVQGVMKVNGMCRKTARVRVGFSHSINALDELPESQPSWADSVDERIDGLEMGMKDVVTYTPQTLTDEQQAQARTNIGALDVNIETTPVDIGVGLGSTVYYVQSGWLRPCPDKADKELVLQYRRVFDAIGSQRGKPNSEYILLRAKSAYSLYQKGLASESITVTNDPLNATRVYVTWNIATRNNKHYFYYAQVSTAYQYTCTYCVEDDALTNEGYKRPVYRTVNGVGEQDSVGQFRMSANPTEDMNIATKQYVDIAKMEAQQLGLTTATPGKTIKVKTVQDGKPTEWEAVDMPSEGVEWYEVIDMETAENVNDLIISTDKNGRPISGYHALEMVLCFMIPADSTQTSTNGNIWVYPIASDFPTSTVRIMTSVASWKTTPRTYTYLYAGSNRAIFLSGTNTAWIFETDYNNVFNGIKLRVYNAGDHLPAGTKVRCLVLSKGWTA